MGTPATLSYDEYSQDRCQADVVIEQPNGDEPGITVRVGLSPFDIPDAVYLEFPVKDEVVFRFRYPTDEYAEDSERLHPDDPSLSFLLGKHTRRVVHVRVRGAIDRLSAGPIIYDPSVASAWATGLPPQPYNICVRSAALIAKILAVMPAKLRRSAVSAMRSPETLQ